jgi:uncharacterized membrane protein
MSAALLSQAQVMLLPFEVHPEWVLPIVVLCTVLANFASKTRAVARLTSSTARRTLAVDNAVARSFFERGVHKTRDRIGMLVVWFDLEGVVRVVCDSGVDARVPEDVRARVFADLARDVVDEARRADAIAAIGRAFGPYVPRGADKVDELDNAPIVGAAS